MKNWLRFIGGSFFFDKYAIEGAKRGFGNVLFAFLMCFILLFTGLYAGYKCSFTAHYKNSTQLNAAVNGIFASEGLNLGLKTQDRRAVSGLDGSFDNGFVINTFKNADDAKKYAVDGFNVIFDTRPAQTTYDDFTAYCTPKGGGDKITYEEYIALSENARQEYTFVIEYSGEALVFDDAKREAYMRHLDLTSDKSNNYYNSDIAAEYEELKKNREDMGGDEFDGGIYELYFRSYYPDISQTELYGVAPTVRTWYMHNVINGSYAGYYLCILSDMLVSYFVTDGGVPLSVYGYYMKMDGFELDGNSPSEIKASADEFIRRAFNGADGLNISVYFVNLLQIIPLIILCVLVLTAVMIIVCKLSKAEYGAKFTWAFKIVSSFILMSSVFTAVISLILAFFIPRSLTYSFTILAFVLIILARCIVLMITRHFKKPKEI